MLGQHELRIVSEAAVTARMTYLINFIGCSLVDGSVEQRTGSPVFGSNARGRRGLIKGKYGTLQESGVRNHPPSPLGLWRDRGVREERWI